MKKEKTYNYQFLIKAVGTVININDRDIGNVSVKPEMDNDTTMYDEKGNFNPTSLRLMVKMVTTCILYISDIVSKKYNIDRNQILIDAIARLQTGLKQSKIIKDPSIITGAQIRKLNRQRKKKR